MIIDDPKFAKLHAGDVKELGQISKQSYIDGISCGNSSGHMQTYLDCYLSEEKLLEELKEPKSEFYFAEIDRRVIGYFKINFGEAQTDLLEISAMELERIYVIKEFQNKKIGQ